jgi:hypothetical protein
VLTAALGRRHSGEGPPLLLADRVVLASPSKVDEITHGKKKTDHHDAPALAERLSEGKVSRVHRPTPRRGERRTPARHREYFRWHLSALEVKMRRIASDDNAECKGMMPIRKLAQNEAERRHSPELTQTRPLKGNALHPAAAPPARQATREAIARVARGVCMRSRCRPSPGGTRRCRGLR